jgi:hypothetical protein
MVMSSDVAELSTRHREASSACAPANRNALDRLDKLSVGVSEVAVLHADNSTQSADKLRSTISVRGREVVPISEEKLAHLSEPNSNPLILKASVHGTISLQQDKEGRRIGVFWLPAPPGPY